MLAALLVLPWTLGRAAIVEEIVAKVNNRIITKSEFEERSQYILSQLYRQYSGAELDQQMKTTEESMLANMITELLLLERAESLFDMDKVRKSLMDDFRQQQKISSDEELDKLLKAQNMTRKDLEEQLMRMALPQEIVNYDIKRRISVSEREIQDYYNAHIKDYETPPTLTLREIVLFYEGPARAEAMVRAQGIERELKAGTDFLELVQRDSEAGTREGGGLLGPLKEGELLPELAQAAAALDPGQVSEPIDTGQAIEIIRVEARTPRVVKSLQEVHDAIYDAIRQDKFKPRFEKFVKGLWKEGEIEVMPKYQRYLVVSPLNPGTAPASGPPPS
ncbi:MAG TPA: peptidyl-prolyl cis-trans isomerase [Candidatus Polarisedimenticolia bacterium]|nr:peptidyl-prolyl cis-trans isomerase [Candidatus Polarisedimenticolia bacterium]